jgi:hypothetical protein
MYQVELKRLRDPNANPILIKAIALPKLTSTLYAPKFEGIVSKEIPVKRIAPQILIGMDQAYKINIQNTTTKVPSDFSLNQSAIGPEMDTFTAARVSNQLFAMHIGQNLAKFLNLEASNYILNWKLEKNKNTSKY